MLTKSILTAAAIALVAGVSSATAAPVEELKSATGAYGFVTLDLAHAAPIPSSELSDIRGAGTFLITPSTFSAAPGNIITVVTVPSDTSLRLCGFGCSLEPQGAPLSVWVD